MNSSWLLGLAALLFVVDKSKTASSSTPGASVGTITAENGPYVVVQDSATGLQYSNYGRTPGIGPMESDPFAGVPLAGISTTPSPLPTGLVLGPNERALLAAVAGQDQDSAAYYLQKIQAGVL